MQQYHTMGTVNSNADEVAGEVGSAGARAWRSVDPKDRAERLRSRFFCEHGPAKTAEVVNKRGIV